MNSVQTVTLNGALSQNWVGCTVRTPKTQVARTLRAQCPCRGRCCAHSMLVARIAPRSWAHVVTSFSCPAQARSRHHFQVATSWTTKPGCDVNPMSRPPFCPTKTAQVAASKIGSRHQLPWCSQNHVATTNRCRDITQANPGRDTKTRSRPSWRLPYVVTSISCRDLISTHSGIFRSRHHNSRSRPSPLPLMS